MVELALHIPPIAMMFFESEREATVPSRSTVPDASPALLERCKSGDLASFEELYRQYRSYVYSLAWRFHGNRFDAEDSVQETFLSLFRSIRGFHGRSRFPTWLYRVLLNACIDRRRRERNTAESRDFTIESIHPSYEPPTGDAVLRAALQEEIAKLPELQRAVFLLYAVEGFTHAEIAETMEMRIGTSKSYYHRAREVLKKKLTARGIRLEEAS